MDSIHTILESKSVVGIRFSKEILPFISNLSREFTKYSLSDIAGMSSAYAIRIYELLSQYRSIGKRGDFHRISKRYVGVRKKISIIC
jgi:plasmid replication initiation protein